MAYQTSAFAYEPVSDPTKRVITDAHEFERLINFLDTRKHIVFDYETSGLDWFKDNEAVGIAFGAWDDSDQFWAAYVPFRHRTGERQLDINRIGPAIGRVLGNPSTLKIAHNIKFEDHFSRREGWVVAGPRYDTMVGAKLFDENRLVKLEYRASTDLGLGDAAYEGKRILDECIKQLAKQNKMGKKKYLSKHGYSEVPINQCGYYAGFDVTHTGGLYRFYENWGMSSNYPRIWPTEMALTEVLCDTEQAGLPLDIPYLERLYTEMSTEKARVQKQFNDALHGHGFDLSSDDKLRNFMTNVMGLQWEKQTDSGLASVDAQVLEAFAEQYEMLRWVLEYRDFQKIESTYTHSLIDLCDANGFLHGNLQQIGTVTGRLSCATPNYQNMPNGPRIRQAFLVRGKGWVRLYLDYSQIELRVLAWYSRDPIMVDVYLHNGDIHERTRQEVSHALQREIPRRLAKIVNFGLSYGLTAQGLANQSGLPKAEAEEFMAKFFERYHGITGFRQELCAYARRNNNCWSNAWGRTRRIDDLTAPEKWKRNSAERRMVGSAIQGTAAELTKESMVRISRWLKAENIPALITNTVHDEIQIDMPQECLPLVLQGAKSLMEAYPEFSPIPIITDADVTDTHWADKAPAAEFMAARPEIYNNLVQGVA